VFPNWLIIVLTYVLPPALAAAFSGYAVHRWKGRADYIEKRLDEMCQIIEDTTAVSSAYWMKAQSAECSVEEAQIRAGLAKIAGLRVLLEGYTSNVSTRELRAAEAAFLRETTGGDFGVHNRTADIERATGCYYSAAAFIVAIRQGRMNDLRGWWQRT
jgi:hypothetical protein